MNFIVVCCIIYKKDNLLENLGLIFDNLNDGLALLSLNGKILKVNQILLKIGGYKRQDLEGKNAMKSEKSDVVLLDLVMPKKDGFKVLASKK